MQISLDFLNKSNLEWLQNNIIFLTIHGSHCYGTNIETSDIDLKGLAIPPKQYFFGYLNKFEQAEFTDPDCVIYDFRKFVQLATDANPNILEILFTDPSDYVIKHPIMDKLLEYRDVFISKRVRWTFSGYAHSQLKKINSHYKWLKNAPTHKPTREEFKLPERTLIPADQLKAAEALISKKLDEWNFNFDVIEKRADRIFLQNKIHNTLSEIVGASMFLESEKLWRQASVFTNVSDNVIEALNKEKAYKSKMREWESYNKWLKERNPERAKLEKEFGYDLKHAMHLIRLMTMCEEILETGKVIVKRPDAQKLLDIRNGKWTYEEVLDWSKKQEEKVSKLYETSKLPREPDRLEIENLCKEIIEEYLL